MGRAVESSLARRNIVELKLVGIHEKSYLRRREETKGINDFSADPKESVMEPTFLPFLGLQVEVLTIHCPVRGSEPGRCGCALLSASDDRAGSSNQEDRTHGGVATREYCS